MTISLSAITEGLHLTVKCKKNAFGGRAPPGPVGGAYSAPQTPYLDLKGPTSKGGQARSYVQARGGSFLLVPRRLNFLRHK